MAIAGNTKKAHRVGLGSRGNILFLGCVNVPAHLILESVDEAEKRLRADGGPIYLLARGYNLDELCQRFIDKESL
jgi:hypothetical protein